MPKTYKLSLKQETVSELSPDELGNVSAGASQVCLLWTLACVSVANCITEEYTCLCPHS